MEFIPNVGLTRSHYLEDMHRYALLVFLGLFLVGATQAQEITRTPSGEGAQVYIISPADGDVVSGPVTVKFGLKGMGVAPAGISYPNTGHHHLLVDAETLPPLNQPIPTDHHHRHFGKGQTETTVELEPGTHTLQLIFADMSHIPHDPVVVSEKITITVK